MGARAERAAEVRKLKSRGLTNKQVAKRLELSPNYVSALVNDPTGERDRLRKLNYRGTCRVCGGRTTGCNGPKKAPTMCNRCHEKERHEQRYWTQETIVEAIHSFAKEHGRRPVSTEWLYGSHGVATDGYPNTATVLREFGKWADAIEAAGYERPHVGTKIRRRRSSVKKSTQKKQPEFVELSLEELCAYLRKLSPWGVAPSTKKHESLRQAFARKGLTWRDACKESGVRPRKHPHEF